MTVGNLSTCSSLSADRTDAEVAGYMAGPDRQDEPLSDCIPPFGWPPVGLPPLNLPPRPGNPAGRPGGR